MADPSLLRTSRKKLPYRKSEAVRELERLANAEARLKHPTCPHLAPRKYRDDTANGITRSVIDYIRLIGGQAERINSTGRYIDRTKTFNDVTGRTRRIGTAKWIRGSGQKGTADISSVIRGRALKIEVKTSDRQSKHQKKYQDEVQQAGCVYLIVRSFEDFYNWCRANEKV